MHQPEDPIAHDQEAVEYVDRTWRLGSGYDPLFLFESGDGGLDLIRNHLLDQDVQIQDFDPGQPFLEHINDLSIPPTEDHRRPVLWVQQPDFAASIWAEVLPILNMRRARMSDQLHAVVIFAGPPQLHQIAQTTCGDLLSTASIYLLHGNHHTQPTRKRLTWLHLSDFHFKADTLWVNQAHTRELLTALKAMERPDLVFLTGDIAATGQWPEYQRAREFFYELGAAIRHNDHTHWFAVPGNHDVDRTKIGRVEGSILRDIQSAPELEATLNDEEAMTLLSRRLSAYYTFTGKLLGPARAWEPTNPWRADTRVFDGLRVGILQLNSTWAGGLASDKGRLLIGERQWREGLDLTPGCHLRFALAHHPLSYLPDYDAQAVRDAFSATGGVHFFLRGHLHQNDPIQHLPADGTGYLELPAGAVYDQNPNWTGFMFGEVDLTKEAGQVAVQCYTWNRRGFWMPDTFKDHRDGIIRRTIACQALQPQTQTADPVTQRRRYRQAAAAFHGSVHFVGLAEDTPRPNTGIANVFVPLSLQTEDEQTLTTQALAQRLINGDAPARLVVLGDPGSGKSTLCKYLALAASGETDLTPDAEPLPLLIPFREYVAAAETQRNLSLFQFLLDQSAANLSIQLDPAYLKTRLAQGDAILLLDGMDEVGSPGDRVHMRDRIQAFCAAHPRVPVLLTSRFSGYQDAPMRTEGDHAFQTLRLTPFSDDELNQFVTRWYAVMLADDPVKQAQRTGNLIKRLAESPPARELARNPLLATLLALVHYYRVELPGERARLYEAVIKTLLETWPTSRNRQFMGFDYELQLTYLATLALQLQEARTAGNKQDDVAFDREVGGGNILVERNSLWTRLTEILKPHHPDRAQSLAREFVHFLEYDSGLIQEQRPGRLGFFHLTLLEYLAGRGLDHREGEDLSEALHKRYDQDAWLETCLLTVGHKATDEGFLNQLFEVFKDRGDKEWTFLLLCLREEAAFHADVVRVILDQAARLALDEVFVYLGEWQTIRRLCGTLAEFSKRHGRVVGDWLVELSRSDEPETLRRYFALIHENDQAVAGIKARSDASFVGGALLDFFPSDIGRWAVGMATPDEILNWARDRLALDDDFYAGLVVFREPNWVQASALALRTTVQAIHWMQCVGQNTLALAKQHRMPDLAVVGETNTGNVFPKQLLDRSQPQVTFDWSVATYSTGLICHYFIGFGRDFGRYFGRYFGLDFGLDFGRDFGRDFGLDFGRYFGLDFGRYFGLDFGRYFGLDFGRDFGRYFGRYFGQYFPEEVRKLIQTQFEFRSLEAKQSLKTKILAPRPATVNDNGAYEQFIQFALQIACETAAGLISTHGMDLEQRQSYLTHRVQNHMCLIAMNQFEWFKPDGSPHMLALYLAMGFRQVTTTWKWPGCQTWQDAMAEEPQHWLPRAQWHLCKLIDHTGHPDHIAAYHAALADGLNDPQLPGYAQAMPRLAGS